MPEAGDPRRVRAGTGLLRGGEFGLIRRIQGRFPEGGPAVLIGIGDDAAALKPSPGKILLVTVDTLREGVHFASAWKDPYSVGWKSVAVSLSDIAAMGGIPKYLLLSLALPSNFPDRDVSGLLRGIRRGTAPHKVALVGGNISRSVSGLSVDTVLIGEVEPDRLLTRSGGRPGDAIYVTGTLGDAAAGLERLNQGDPATGYLAKRHLRPTPRLREGRLLAVRRLAASAVDLSDGLLLDLSRLCTQSRTGARIDSRSLPLSLPLRREAGRLVHDPVRYALSGGEDYEILFTVRPEKVRAVESLGKKGGIRLTRIGEMTDQREGLSILDSRGKVRKAKPEGFDHFRKI